MAKKKRSVKASGEVWYAVVETAGTVSGNICLAGACAFVKMEDAVQHSGAEPHDECTIAEVRILGKFKPGGLVRVDGDE